MKIQSAIKKVEKHLEVKVQKNGNEYFIRKDGRELSFIKNGGESEEAICFRTRGLNDIDDVMSDYCAGVFWDNVTQAIRSFQR